MLWARPHRGALQEMDAILPKALFYLFEWLQ